MKESKVEIKYKLPKINLNINDVGQTATSNGINKLFKQLENIENLRTNSLIITEI